jgi:hypothetical protein
VPVGAHVLASSGDLADGEAGSLSVPTDTTVWITLT